MALIILATGFWILDSSPVSAAPTQEDFFRSVQESVGSRPGQSGDKSTAILFGVLGAIVMSLLVASRVRGRQASPKKVQHAGKLIKEIMKTVPLKPKELKQLKALVEETKRDESADPVESPLTLLLCPSVLARTLKERPPARMDRVVLGQLVRKMGVGKAPAKAQ